MKFLTRLLTLIWILCLFTGSAAFAQEQELPAAYDLRNVNGKSYVSPVKNQGFFGTCWAFSCMNAVESNALTKGADSNINLSEKALAWYAFQQQGSKQMSSDQYEGVSVRNYDTSWQYDLNSRVYSAGGTPFAAASQMSTWLGNSTEEEIPYLNSNKNYVMTNSGPLASPFGDWTLAYGNAYDDAYHLQNCEFFSGPASNGLSSKEYVQKAKELIYQNGAIQISYCCQQKEGPYYNTEHFCQYIDTVQAVDHGVSIVGWDDNYPAENFNTTPPGDGAWIVKNSWGTSFGVDGYFYLSYYDQSIGDSASFDVETEELGYSYDKNNQYDFLGWKASFYNNAVNLVSKKLALDSVEDGGIQVANVFTTSSNSTLRAVSASPNVNGTSTVKASIYILNDNYTSPVDGKLAATATATFDNSGFYTLELENPVELPAGTSYSVVEQVTTTNARFKQNTQLENEVVPKVQGLPVEFGLNTLYSNDMINQQGQKIGLSFNEFVAKAQPGESYVYGLNATSGQAVPAWQDITDPEVMDKLSVTLQTDPETGEPMNAVPGNAMIKAYTTYGIGDGVINPTSIVLSSQTLTLATPDAGDSSAHIGAVVEPANSTTGYTWSISPSTVAVVEGTGSTVTVKALHEGVATLTVTTENELTATAQVVVNNDSLIASGVDILSNTPDTFTVILRNLRANPNIEGSEPAEQVSLFCWSEVNQSDINAKRMSNIPGTNDWIFEGISVNGTEANNYFIDASKININVYASPNSESDGELVNIATYNWITPGTINEASVAYIAYCQNTGFVSPTVWNGPASGNIDNPNSTHMEGFRVSSGLLGLEIASEAYANGKGWLPQVGDGVYCGTMWEDRPLESVKLNVISQEIEHLDVLVELNYRVYVKNQGWTDWVSSGQEAGAAGSGKPIQAMQVTLTVKDIPLD